MTRGGPLNATHLMATLSLPARDPRRLARRGRRDLDRDDPLPARRRSCSAGSACSGASGSRAGATESVTRRPADAGARDGRHRRAWSYLERCRAKVITVYLPLSLFLIVLLFPFYWMALTSIKPNNELLDMQRPATPCGWSTRRSTTSTSCCSRPPIRAGCGTPCIVSVSADHPVADRERDGRLRDRARCATGARARSAACIFLAYLVPPSILFIPLAIIVFQVWPVRQPARADPDLSDHPDPVLDLALMGYFKSIPYELEECALIDGAGRSQILTKIILPLSIPGLISAGIFSFTLCWNEFIYALTFISSSENKTVPVAVLIGAGRGRRLPLGRADGRRAARLDAGRDHLLVLRRALRLLDDRRDQGVRRGARRPRWSARSGAPPGGRDGRRGRSAGKSRRRRAAGRAADDAVGRPCGRARRCARAGSDS